MTAPSASVAEHMRASVLHAPGDVRVDTVPVPRLDPDQVLVRIAAVGVCGSDVHYFHEGRIGSFVVEQPMILGHESAGTIVAVGAAVSPDRVGERVSIEPQRACRHCDQCKHGRYNLCTSMEFYATPPIDGAFAEYAAIQTDYAHPIPDTMSIEAAALCEPLSVGIWANQKAQTAPGSSVFIAGAGPIGVIAAQVARAFGATRIIVSDPVAERREVALRFGATEVVDPMVVDVATADYEVDAFIDASGAEPAVRAGIHAVAPAGRVVLVGMGADEIRLPVSRIQNRELVVTGVFRYANTWPIAIRLIAAGLVDVDALVTGRFGLDEVEAALDAATRPDTLKAVVVP
ncbi:MULTISPECIES: NAD(P)-dependent alcohol dehydrogenase [unclassified Curtobacterium]|uniref:NAD(P)-dependent alcohol dehydrogenase n=1 Tax=unclassified Curtobacterium TaxID=257496 RepID=UPI000DA94ED3|nr:MULTISPECIES: NAD(P)-dependent alcohol dehydrogenase [unclassified Curtobacterium]PZE23254.1 NAD(P)-dependent alcohol dehydrogenase [Curtobacterium sp. MCBD17_028]WIE54107.1 NAD(P)-dependent alcohol dehydrogenase [Curtobacterium sp. MCBD17_003]